MGEWKIRQDGALGAVEHTPRPWWHGTLVWMGGMAIGTVLILMLVGSLLTQ